ncbi:MAG: CocE/NonD family hydrolase, partial [Chloroflexi bacterium]
MRVTVDIDVPARMRDGTTLRANVYRPDGDGPWPTLLTRSPYGKDDQGALSVLDPVQAARKGFMVVIQDCRGRFASEGEWTPFWFEEQDGYDSVEWAARLPGSSGRVGMYGESYFGNTQWLAAVGQPPSLAAISPALTWSEPMDGVFARGGAVELGLALPWSIQTGMNHFERSQRDIAPLIDAYDRILEDGYDAAALDRYGLGDIGLFRGIDDPEFAARTRVAGRHSRVVVPTFHTAGWHDLFLQGTLDNYVAMSGLGRDARLLVGPWTHATFADPIGEEVFGVRAARFGAPSHRQGDANDLQLAWFRHHLADDRTVDLSSAPVRIFVMGRNVWRDETSWPLARAKQERWFFHADGSLSP